MDPADSVQDKPQIQSLDDDGPQPGPSCSTSSTSTLSTSLTGEPVQSEEKKEFTRVDDEDSDEYEEVSSSDDEVIIINPGKEDYIEVPRGKGEPPPKTRPVNRIPRSQLVPFWSLYYKQPEHIKEMIRLHFYKGRPIVHPPPLSLFLQKVRAYKEKQILELEKAKAEQETEDPIPILEIPNPVVKSTPTEGDEKKQKNGKVSMVDFYETDTQLIHVDYPGRVINPEKAIATMGGYNNLTKVFSNYNKKLSVRFRPEDPYCNSVNAEAHPTVGLLIKVRRRKPLLSKPKVDKPTKKEEPELQVIDLEGTEEIKAESSANSSKSVIIDGIRYTKDDMLKEDKILMKSAVEKNKKLLKEWNVRGDPEHYYVKVPKDYEPKIDSKLHLEAMGIVYRTYKFQGLCDFQFLPMKKTKDGLVSTRDKIMPLIGQPGAESAYVGEDLLSGQTEVERFLLPTFMSRIDRPQTYIQEQLSDADTVKTDPLLLKKHSKDVITTSRQKRNVYTLAYSFQLDKSKNPIPTEPLENALEDVSKRRLHGSAMTLVRRCFERRPIWTKIALEYETQLPSLTLKYVLPCVSYFATNGPWRSLWVRLGFDPRDDPSTFLYQTVDFRVPLCYKQFIEEGERADDSSFVFRTTQMPPKSQMFYQICDLKCDEIERVIDIATERMGKYELQYDQRFGWLKEGTFEYIRMVLIQYLELQLEEMGKIPEYPVKKILLPNGELEPKEKLQPRPREIRRLRRVKTPKHKKSHIAENSPSTSNTVTRSRSKESNKAKSKLVPPPPNTWAYQGILQDLSIKDISTFESREDVDNDRFEIMDESLDDNLPSEDEDESYSEDEGEDVSDEDDEDESIEAEEMDSVKVEVKHE